MGKTQRMRFVMLVVAGSVLWWGASVVSESWQPARSTSPERISAERTLSGAIADVEQAALDFDTTLKAAAPGDDLSKGWQDLHSDTLSVLRDIARRPTSDSARDFSIRVESFWNTYAESGAIGSHTDEWKRFEAAFNDLVGGVRTVSSDGIEATGSP